jgi:hypothetical protein
MKESAEFLLDFLIENDKGAGHEPSHSPENQFRAPMATSRPCASARR